MSKHISCGGCYFLHYSDEEKWECHIVAPIPNHSLCACELWTPSIADEKSAKYMKGLAIAKGLRKRLGLSESDQ